VKRETPDWAQRALILAGGVNRFGDPNFRLSWSDSLFDWIGGKWEDRNAAGELVREVKELRWAVKYPWLAHRWIVEKWVAPEKFGTPETWNRQTREWGEEGNIPQLGPYPDRGRYLFCCVLDINGRFVQLTPSILDDVIYAAIHKQKHVASLAELKQAQEEKDRRWLAESRELLERPAFNAETFVSVA
jgi:hypothetical protein